MTIANANRSTNMGNVPETFAGFKKAWHGVFNELPNGAVNNFMEALPYADMNWTPNKVELINPITNAPIGQYAILRSYEDTTNERHNQYVSVVGERYIPRSIQENLNMITGMMNGQYELDSLGMFSDSKYAVNFKAPGFEVVPGDTYEVYYQVCDSFDGSTKTQFFVSTVRAVCTNTLRHAINIGKANGEMLAVKHTKGANAKLEKAASLLQIAGLETNSFRDKLRFLTKVQADSTFLTNFLTNLLATKEETKESKQFARKVEAITAQFEVNDGNQIDGIRGTAYAALQAVTNAMTHNLGEAFGANTSKKNLDGIDPQAISSEFNKLATQKTQAFDLLFEMASKKANS